MASRTAIAPICLFLCLLCMSAPGFAATPPGLPNPALPGAYRVLTLCYGSGTDLHRPEYGAAADLPGGTVDASALLPAWTGRDGKRRERYWGFGPDKLPLNGRVWYPEGDGSFPLVLMVHGNHNAKEFSDPGYAYLGQLLASRGFILASVDENFLNGMRTGLHIFDFKGQENGVRAWLLLKHLDLWRTWNKSEGNPFHRRVDLDRIALIGHSRGGEAAAMAASLNELPRHPDNALVPMDFDFIIKSVVAIAPSDGQYMPANKPVALTDLNYLVLQGSYDSDVSLFLGIRQYQRVRFTGGSWIKAALYIERANHGQFNTVWGRRDLPAPIGSLLNTGPLLPGEEQRRIAEVYISAFLDATLRGEEGYRAIFRDYRAAGDWLPRTSCLNQYEDASYRVVSDYEEDVDVTTASISGGRQEGENLTLWREGVLRYRAGAPQDNNAVFLGWRDGRGSYTITLPDGLAQEWRLSPETLLVFSLADAGRDPAAENRDPYDLTIEVETADGTAARVPLSRFRPLPLQFEAQFLRSRYLNRKIYKNPSEPVLLRYEIPFTALCEMVPAFDPARLKTIRFVFDRGEAGAIILDDVGFRAGSR